jgi:hypothetical protein
MDPYRYAVWAIEFQVRRLNLPRVKMTTNANPDEMLERIPGSREFLASLDSPCGHKYVALEFPRVPIGPGGEQFRIRIYRSKDSGSSWEEIPLVLDLRSRLWNGLFATWPPEHLECLYWESEQLVMEFRDPWIPWEKPILPARLDEESFWRATYLETSKKWSIQRNGFIEYDTGSGSSRHT